jgi:hypothetical protein
MLPPQFFMDVDAKTLDEQIRLMELVLCAFDSIRPRHLIDKIEVPESRTTQARIAVGEDSDFRPRWQALADILGPLVMPSLPTGWQTWEHGIIPILAEQIAQKRDWSLCGVLSDALYECDEGVDPGLLEHLRTPRQHYLGCWVIDLLRGHMTSPRRSHLQRLPEVERPARYEVLVEPTGPIEGPQLLELCEDKQALVTALVDGTWPVRRTRESPLAAWGLSCTMYWSGDLIVSIRLPEVRMQSFPGGPWTAAVWLEREVVTA